MQAIIVEPISEVRDCVEKMIKNIDEFSKVNVFDRGVELLRNVKQHRNEQIIALVNWKLPDISGVAVAQLIGDYSRNCRVIFMADDEKSASDAFEAGVKNILRMPVKAEELKSCISRLIRMSDEQQGSTADNFRNPQDNEHVRVRINTFGYFDIYVNDNVVVFSNARAKELLAMLVDGRGGVLTMERIIEMFWPDESCTTQHKTLYRKALYSLRNTLKEYGADELLICKRNQKALKVDGISCDYFEFLNGNRLAMQAYDGNYMAEYSWGEVTNGKLWRMKLKKDCRNRSINVNRNAAVM